MLLPLALLAATADAGLPTLCAEPWGRVPMTAEPDPAAARALLRQSEAVLRVRAVRELPADVPQVQFEVLGVLRGTGIRRSVAFPGRLDAADDFNEGAVPYRFGRPDVHDGSCFAEGYRAGAEYLLLLKRVGGTLSPYWAPLAPTTERLSGEGDPWLAWVRRELRRQATPPSSKAATAGVAHGAAGKHAHQRRPKG